MNEFISKLRGFRRGLNLQIAVRTILLALLCAFAALHAYYLLWLNLDSRSAVLSTGNVAIKIVLASGMIYLILSAYRRLYSELSAARWLDRQIEHQDDLYQNLYELNLQKEDQSVLDALSTRANARLKHSGYRFPALFAAPLWFAILFALAGFASVWALSWNNFRYAATQFYTNRAESIAYKQSIELSPGTVTVGKGEQLAIEVLNPDTRLTHRLFYRWDKQWRELAMTDFRYVFNSLEYSIEYYVQNEVSKSPLYKVTCLDRPFARRWELNYKYPAYTGLPAVRDTLSYGNIQAFKHTEVILSVSSNIPAAKAVMRFADGSSKEMQAADATNFSTRLTVTEPKTWYLELTDQLGRRSEPEEKTISLIPDQPPEIRLLFPGEDVALDQTLRLPLIITASDDFGLRNLTLRYQVKDGPPEAKILQSLISTKLTTLDHVFDLSGMNLLPGDEVTYWAEVFDNSPDRQSAATPKFKARFPSMEEIFREMERQELARTEELQSTLEEAKDLQKEFEQKRRELLKEDNLRWEDKKQLENILSEQQQLAEQVENVADDFQQMIDKLQSNDAVSADMLEKMQKIQELMREISNEELEKALSKFEQALQNVDMDELRKAMENFKFSLEDFAQKLDQTLDLLESIKKEQALDKALQLSKEMEKLQSALQEKTGDPKQSAERLSEEQKDIADKFEQLKEETRKTDALLDPAKDQDIKRQLNELRQEMQNGGLKENLNQSQQQLMQNQRAAASQSQSEALDKMRLFTLRLGEMKNSMGGGSQREIMNAMQGAIRELLIFSKQHEELSGRYGSDPYPIVQDLIAHYEGIQVSLNRLFSVPMVTMVLPPKFYIDLTDTNKAYRDVFVNVNEMQYIQIPAQLAAIQRGLNLMIYDLMQAMNNASSGSGGGSGMQSLMQMLDQMSQQQMAMNMLTEQMMFQLQQGGQMNSAMQQQMQKLASDQERMAENLKRALQNNPEAQKQGNAIKQIIDEAEAISRQLRSNQLSEDLLRRQENILSRLLDAQRSINKREFSEKRKAETADPALKQGDSTDYNALRREAMLDDAYRSFPPAYQQVILKYLKLLNE